MEVLDKNGLQYFWGKAKEYVDNNTGVSNYTDLSNKPRINNVELIGNKSLSELGIQQTVVDDVEPTDPSVEVWIDPSGDSVTVPTKTSDLINDSGFITNSVNDLTNYTKTSDLSSVATSGSYNDLSNKPTVPTKTSDLTNDSNFLTSAIFSYDNETETLTITTEV